MRNAIDPIFQSLKWIVAVMHRRVGGMGILAPLIAGICAGCTTEPISIDLERSRAALAMNEYADAQAAAETYLAGDPSGPRAAEANYLKGRALEDRTAATADEARDNLQGARTAYVAALTAGTQDRALEGLIRASLADVAYWQEDFAVAAEQGNAAYGLLSDDDARAWTLYRTGVAQQRMGSFEEADKSLNAVQTQHPGSEPASRARPRTGVRAFSVQAATFAQASIADSAIASLTQQGFSVTKRLNDSGKTVIMVGPYQSYAQASGVRTRLAAKYPDAMIVP
ncbi:MAG: SPOR domain-containing protein [Burkholderiales bacterium]|nr:SPOR domain-containing protein [Phycisphaerae bacterium]